LSGGAIGVAVFGSIRGCGTCIPLEAGGLVAKEELFRVSMRNLSFIVVAHRQCRKEIGRAASLLQGCSSG